MIIIIIIINMSDSHMAHVAENIARKKSKVDGKTKSLFYFYFVVLGLIVQLKW